MEQIVRSIFDVSSIWSVIARGAIWLGLSLVVLISVDKPDPDESLSSVKANLGFFTLFVALSSVLVFLLFGYSPTPGA